MKDFKKSHNIAGQSNKTVQKSHKHDANLQKNSSLYFQIGLILCLLATYGIFEMKFETKIYDQAALIPLNTDDNTFDAKNYVPEPDVPKEKQIKKIKKQVIISKFDIKENDAKIEETKNVIVSPEPTSEPMDPKSFIEPTKPEEKPDKIFDMTNIEMVPIYPGCENKTTNKERVKCMSEKLGKLVQKKFDTDLASQLGLYGVQKIYVQFKIDQNGQVTEIQSRAPHVALEKEAKRIAQKIPVMKPGKQRDVPVSVIYNLPIIFQVN